MNLQRDRSAWLHGPEKVCQVQPLHPAQCRRFVLLGAPGVGKGTQAALLSAAFGTCHLSTGDLFRRAQACDPATLSPGLRQAVIDMQAGHLVSDETVLQLILERTACLTCQGGFILDGFPRTVAQAAALDVLLGQQNAPLECAISYELDPDALAARISGRRTCPVCHGVYHLLTRPPREPDLCDICRAPLTLRADDWPEAVRVRQQAYLAATHCLRDYYADRDLLLPIDAHGTPEEVFGRTITALTERAATPDA
ncbi:MAG: nucleoside monophosphate kinase [Candidatus Didemnitutus sp.]|nr:nucleoside monophosphate kinase [Candidatus Didemnitutus sp.]